MAELSLTRHFEQRWLERVGNWPTVEGVSHFMQDSIRVQWCEDFVRPDGTTFRMLAIYWHPELDLIMKVDTKTWSAITVHSPRRYVKKRGERRNGGTEGRRGFMPAIAARIARVRERFGIAAGPARAVNH